MLYKKTLWIMLACIPFHIHCMKNNISKKTLNDVEKGMLSFLQTIGLNDTDSKKLPKNVFSTLDQKKDRDEKIDYALKLLEQNNIKISRKTFIEKEKQSCKTVTILNNFLLSEHNLDKASPEKQEQFLKEYREKQPQEYGKLLMLGTFFTQIN